MGDVRFYCENCGKHVKPRDKICTSCGSFFSQVRCPVCAFQADVDQFLKGCPQCGYSGKADDQQNLGHQGMVEVDFPFESERAAQRKAAKKTFSFKFNPGPLGVVVMLALLIFGFLAMYYVTVLKG